MRRSTGRLMHMVPCLSLLFGFAAVSSAADDTASSERKDIVLRGDAVCTRCHDETESYPVLAIAKTRHGTMADARTPTCTSCHGESRRHVENVRREGETGRPKPDRTFGGSLSSTPRSKRMDEYLGPAGKRNTGTPVNERNGACLDCHQGGERLHWQGSAHDSRNVACTSCHQIHTQHDRVRDKFTQPDICFDCHKEQRAQTSRSSHHPIREGKVACSDCHNPHGTAGVKLLVRDNVVDTCYTCHMEKRGPFIFNHQPVTDDCTICHNPHGTNIASMLKSRPPFLCQQCHEPTSHRGNIPGMLPGTGNAAGSRGLAQARSCLNCHTNIHGGNNPTNSPESRSLRR